MDPISQATGGALSELTLNYGLAGILGVLLVALVSIVGRFLLNEFKACKEENKEFAEKLAKENVDALNRNTEAFHGLKETIAVMKDRMDR